MLTPTEAKKLLQDLFDVGAKPSPAGPLVLLDTVLKMLEPLCEGGFTIVVQKGAISVGFPEAAPKTEAAP